MNGIILSQEQQKAIEKIDGASLLLAVPGSGKTTTLISRIGRMIYDFHIPPERILVITYTNAAAKDMRERFAAMFNATDAERIDFRTINSFCYAVVVQFSKVTGRPKPKDDTDRQKNIRMLFEKVYDEKFPEEIEIKNFETSISLIKNSGMTDEEIEGLKVDGREVKPLYDAYMEHMKSQNKMDYDDQIVFAHMLFKNNTAGLRDYYADKYPYVLVDEAQDTSKLQHEVIRLLTQKHGNLFMVGDEDQSIYGFRAAYPEALIHFEERYPGGIVSLLQTNYRSAQSIVKAASNVIERNVDRHKKTMVAAREDAGMVSLRQFKYRTDQYGEICKELKESEGQTAILYRNNDSALPLISYLEKEGIPYSCRGMEDTFFSNKVIRDAMQIIAFAFDPRSFDLIWKIYYKLDLRIRKKHLYDATQNLDYGHQQPILSALYQQRGMGKRQKDKILSLMHQLDMISTNDNAKDAIHRIRTEVGYKNANSEKLFILEAMAYSDETVDEFRERLFAMGSKNWDKLYRPGSNVVLSTIHSSKGLEYDKVILIDAVDGILPSADCDLEEERRIFYVGITRAKNELVLCEYNDYSSQFLRETEEKKKKVRAVAKKRPVLKKRVSQKPFHPEDVAEGVLVRHNEYGVGVVEYVKKRSIVINFNGVSKTLMYPYIFTEGIAELVE